MQALEREALIVNIFGGPASGKTTAAARLFVALKLRGADAEMVDELARTSVLMGQLGALAVQPYLFGVQLYRLKTLATATEVVIMDSPLLLNPIYDRNRSPALKALVLEEHDRMRNLNVFVERPVNAPHSMSGRVHGAAESRLLDEKIRAFLEELRVPYIRIGPDLQDIEDVADYVVSIVEAERRQISLFTENLTARQRDLELHAFTPRGQQASGVTG